MKLKTVILENFRCYKERTDIGIGDLTALIGRNDVGKSSVLEALEIFFNSKLVKIEELDACVHGGNKKVRIGCVFADLPSETVLDATATTTLANEYLLNTDGHLEIHKVFECGLKTPKESVFARAHHPTQESANNLLSLKNAQLKARLTELDMDQEGIDLRSNPSIRRAIWDSFTDLNLASVDIPLDEADAKKIWESLRKELPAFALFQADRPSRDEDAEVQDPMKWAITEAITSLEEDLEKIKNSVRERALEVAQRTLDKLREIDPSLAQELSPNFRDEPKWHTLFKLTLTSDNQIPINKRGSGVRRLILLSFFRAEAERRQAASNSSGVIYAIEEPETSQHPSNQKLLIEALSELSDQDDCQVILSTHVPGIAGLLPVQSLRHVKSGQGGRVYVDSEGDAMFDEIAHDLGVLPNDRVRVFVCVEGPNDACFLKHISHKLHTRASSIPDLSSDPRVVVLPLGGQTLKQFVYSHCLKELRRPEIHIYDRDGADPPQYQGSCDEVNNRADGSWATLTKKREIENYLHTDAIEEVLRVRLTFEDNDDVPLLVAKAVHEASDSDKAWDELTDEKREKKESKAKKRLNDEVASRMTYEQLMAVDPDREIEGWLGQIADRLL